MGRIERGGGDGGEPARSPQGRSSFRRPHALRTARDLDMAPDRRAMSARTIIRAPSLEGFLGLREAVRRVRERLPIRDGPARACCARQPASFRRHSFPCERQPPDLFPRRGSSGRSRAAPLRTPVGSSLVPPQGRAPEYRLPGLVSYGLTSRTSSPPLDLGSPASRLPGALPLPRLCNPFMSG